VVEQTPLQDGRNMTMMLAPSKAVLAGEVDGAKPSADDAEPRPKRRDDGQQNGASDGESPTPIEAPAEAPPVS
jgi:translation initiation factor IF-3